MTAESPTLPSDVAGLVEEAQAFLDHSLPSADRPLADDIVRRLAAALKAAARRPGERQATVVSEGQRFLRRYSTNESAWRDLTKQFLDLLGEPHEAPLDLDDGDGK